MGNSSSNPEKNEADRDQVVETSTGTHFFEVHMPTLGFGTFTIFMVALALIAAFLCLRGKYKGKGRSPWRCWKGDAETGLPFAIPSWQRGPVISQPRHPDIAYNWPRGFDRRFEELGTSYLDLSKVPEHLDRGATLPRIHMRDEAEERATRPTPEARQKVFDLRDKE